MNRLVPAAVLAVALLLAGCGGTDEPPAVDVPALSERLEAVDTAISAGKYRVARTGLREIRDLAEQGREDGDLTRAEADRIQVAVTDLLAALPSPEPSPSPSATATAPPAQTGQPDPSSGGKDPKDEKNPGADKGKGDDKGKGKGNG